MSDSFQDVYAKYLQHHDYGIYGYPLRMPEPMSTLPENYQDFGLQIGDVGVVDREGQFNVLFNICKRDDNAVNVHGVPDNFQPVEQAAVKSNDKAIRSDAIYSHGIKRNVESANDYEFESSAPAGAILILPQPVTSTTLISLGEFREVATQQALNWYEFAKKFYNDRHLDRSLYLITGFYKTTSWSLASFKRPTSDQGRILARKGASDSNEYQLKSTFPIDCRSHSGDNINQTVFITGFTISVKSWLPGPVVLQLPGSETLWSILVCLFKAWLNRFRGSSHGHKQPTAMIVEDNPTLSQPFHPSDIINGFLLSKNPSAKVAITHDDQWMEMMKEGLTHEDFLQTDHLRAYLDGYNVDSERENAVVFLRSKTDGTTSSVSPTVDLSDPSSEPESSDSLPSDLEVPPTPTPELEISCPITSESEVSTPPPPSLDDACTVITRIRAQNILSGFKRVPVGFYVLIQFGGNQRRTQNKSIRLNNSGVEWEDKILLSPKAFDTVQFTLYASFELEPMLGSGEALYTSQCRSEELVGGTHLITFSQGESATSAPGPSLLITLGQRYSDHVVVASGGDDSNPMSEASSVLVHETDLGQTALLRYYKQYHIEDIQEAVQYFENAYAQHECPLNYPYRAAVLVNLAEAKFMRCRTDPTSANLEDSISLYRRALELRRPGHPDRPATVLQLAQALLFRYEKQGCNEADADEVNKLMSASHVFSEDSYERQAADLVLETLERCRTVNSGSLAELDTLVRKLELGAKVPSNGYFNAPQRLINLSTALWRRYEERGELSDLNRSSEISKQALQLLHCRDPDRLSGLKTLHSVLWRLFEIHADFSYLGELIGIKEEALQLMPEGHPERLYWVTNLNSHRAKMLESLGDKAFVTRKYDEAIAFYSRAIVVLQSSTS